MEVRTNRQEELRFGVQMDKSPDKLRMIGLVHETGCKRVVDLGAGTGIVAKRISMLGIRADAVDINFKCDSYENTDHLTYYPTDLVNFVEKTENKYDCIILSAVLHELSPRERRRLQKGLKRIADPKGCMILIREPYYDVQPDGTIRPFVSKDSQRSIANEISLLTPQREVREFMATKKLSAGPLDRIFNRIPWEVQLLGLAFTRAYGTQSWDREKHEYRFAFSKNELERWCEGILGTQVNFFYETYDKDYKDYFRNVGYTPMIASGIAYTNCLLVAKKKS